MLSNILNLAVAIGAFGLAGYYWRKWRRFTDSHGIMEYAATSAALCLVFYGISVVLVLLPDISGVGVGLLFCYGVITMIRSFNIRDRVYATSPAERAFWLRYSPSGMVFIVGFLGALAAVLMAGRMLETLLAE